ncbi:uncharacterized protein LOC133832884 [Humulus lupulus]|uniref:uncharacterized protein LOC133832884 n=1 Tax=Humulus lupulus TaxID=3486 RepID=UPI002B40A70C|nr:uncharacterized protein LOC133832884 [Humulus lupulus]
MFHIIKTTEGLNEGRQALLDMLKKAERERKMELQVLLEHRAVTNFPHRNHIQSLLRGWFLRNGSMDENERPPSVAESELGLLRQRHTVSGLREEFSRLDNSVYAQASNSLSDTSNKDNISNRNGEPQENNLYEVRDDICEQSELNYEASEDQEHDSHGILDGRSEFGGNAVEDIDSRESNAHIIEGWLEQVPDNVVRQWQWRRVSNLLHSGFRESLDQLIQSYVERKSHAAVDWELDGSSPSPASIEQDLDQEIPNQSEVQEDAVVKTPSVAPPSHPIPPPPPMWDQRPHRDTWTQHDMHQRFRIEWEIINDIRIDMARLQQRMNNLQRMMETCMDMQLELQRSIRQEVSAALNRPACSQELCEGEGEGGLAEDDTKWDHVRKGMCCICSNTNIDSLLYRLVEISCFFFFLF